MLELEVAMWTGGPGLVGLLLQAVRVTVGTCFQLPREGQSSAFENAQFVCYKFSIRCFPSPQGGVRKGIESIMLMSSMPKKGNILGNNSTPVLYCPLTDPKACVSQSFY